MKIIGLTGSIAMGKSEVAAVFRTAGIPVFDADAEVHRLYDSSEGAALITPFAPTAVVDQKVDRTILSKLVANDSQLLSKLEPAVHAEIRHRRRTFVETAKNDGAAMVLLDIPLLFETMSEADVDTVIVISAPQTEQRRRALQRPGMTPERLDLILSRQMPDHEKRERADIIIDNDGSLAQLQEKTRALILDLQNSSKATHA